MTPRGDRRPAAGPRVPSPASSRARLAPEAGLVLGVVFLFFLPALAPALQYDRAVWAEGEWWRLFTCHLVHWSLGHLLWDAGTLLVIALALGRAGYGRRGAVLLVSALAIPIAVGLLQPELETYRGLSGLVSASFALLLTERLASGARRRALGEVVLPAAVVALFGAKLVFELLTERAVFVDSGAAEFVAVPLAHAVGAVVGVLGALLPLLKGSRGRVGWRNQGDRVAACKGEDAC